MPEAVNFQGWVTQFNQEKNTIRSLLCSILFDFAMLSIRIPTASFFFSYLRGVKILVFGVRDKKSMPRTTGENKFGCMRCFRNYQTRQMFGVIMCWLNTGAAKDCLKQQCTNDRKYITKKFIYLIFMTNFPSFITDVLSN